MIIALQNSDLDIRELLVSATNPLPDTRSKLINIKFNQSKPKKRKSRTA